MVSEVCILFRGHLRLWEDVWNKKRWVIQEAYPKVGWAGWENDPVGPDELTPGPDAEGHINQRLLLQEVVKHREKGRPMVVPFQAELLLRPTHLDGRCRLSGD